MFKFLLSLDYFRKYIYMYIICISELCILTKLLANFNGDIIVFFFF